MRRAVVCGRMEFRFDPPASGVENMRIDADLLEAGDPVVRVYGWQPAAVSLGYSQSDAVVDEDVAIEQHVDVVRRPTGGGALLHAEDEVTYCVVVPRTMVPSDVAASYRRLSAGVVTALQSFGLEADYVEGRGRDDPLCYLRGEGLSIAVGGRKISGGAQKRTRDAVLQHGTLMVTRDVSRMVRLLGGDPARIKDATTSLRDEGVEAARHDVATRLLAAYRSEFAELEAAADDEASG